MSSKSSSSYQRLFFYKKRFWHRRFRVNFVKFLRTPFLQNTSGRLLLIIIDWLNKLLRYSVKAAKVSCRKKKRVTSVLLRLKLTSHGILHYLCSADQSKSFSQLIVSIFIFSQYFFPVGKVWGYLTLLISWFSNFERVFYAIRVKV